VDADRYDSASFDLGCLQPKSCLVARFEYFNSLLILGKCITRFCSKTGPRMCAGRHGVSEVVLDLSMFFSAENKGSSFRFL